MDDDFAAAAAVDPSILDTLGKDLLSVISHVSICMLLVVLLVISLSSPSFTSTIIVSAATLVYTESPFDSTSQKLSSALLNELVFVLLIAVVTFLLLLYYYNSCFSGSFFVLSSMGGSSSSPSSALSPSLSMKSDLISAFFELLRQDLPLLALSHPLPSSAKTPPSTPSLLSLSPSMPTSSNPSPRTMTITSLYDDLIESAGQRIGEGSPERILGSREAGEEPDGGGEKGWRRSLAVRKRRFEI